MEQPRDIVPFLATEANGNLVEPTSPFNGWKLTVSNVEHPTQILVIEGGWENVEQFLKGAGYHTVDDVPMTPTAGISRITGEIDLEVVRCEEVKAGDAL